MGRAQRKSIPARVRKAYGMEKGTREVVVVVDLLSIIQPIVTKHAKYDAGQFATALIKGLSRLLGDVTSILVDEDFEEAFEMVSYMIVGDGKLLLPKLMVHLIKR